MSSPSRGRGSRVIGDAALAALLNASPSRATTRGAPAAQAAPELPSRIPNPVAPTASGVISRPDAIPVGIVAQWSDKKNKLNRPQQFDATSTRLIYWNCRSCGSEFKKRIRDHVADGGVCPSCLKFPEARVASRQPAKPTHLDPTKTIDATPIYSRDRRTLAPMLAFPWEKYADRISDKEDLFISKKLDGVRCVVAYDPVLKKPYFMSRAGNVFESTDYISAELQAAFSRDPSLVLDGEIYNHGDVGEFTFNDIISAVKVTRDKATPEHDRLQKLLQFHTFDMLYGAGVDHTTPFTQRLSALERVMDRLPASSKRVKLLDHELAHKKQVERELDRAVNDGYEGIMIRVGDQPYEYGKRSQSLLKHKRMEDAEFKVTDVFEGTGRLAGMVGAIQCTTDTKPPKTFKASFTVPDDARRTFWLRRKELLIGKMATVQYQELSPAGIPRFGVFKCVRSDASGKDSV